MTTSNRSIVVFPTPADHDRVRDAAARLGLSVSAYLRMAGLEKAQRVLGPIDTDQRRQDRAPVATPNSQD